MKIDQKTLSAYTGVRKTAYQVHEISLDGYTRNNRISGAAHK
jgi:hypothetical protein